MEKILIGRFENVAMAKIVVGDSGELDSVIDAIKIFFGAKTKA